MVVDDSSSDERELLEGVVKWYSLAKGYGFIERAGEADVFVHHTALRDLEDLRPGERVRFALHDAERGPAARDVRLVDPSR